MAQLMSSAPRQISLTIIHLTLVFLVVAKGVEDGIEKWVGFIMPIFVGILFVLVFKSLSLDSSTEALRFFLYPDFSKLNLASLGAAVGQLCFTLSIGFATMITFGSYLRDEALVPRTGFRVATMDSLTALIAGLLIFPLVVSSPMNSRGPVLLFETVPEFLLHIDGGLVFALFFFLCLYLAALGASISILETLVANVCENSNLKRGTATLITVLVAGVAALFPALSSTLFVDVQWGGRGLLEIIDSVLINWILPVLALIFSQIVVYEVSENIKRNEFLALQGASSKILFDHWRMLMKWIVPAIIILGLALQAIGIFVG
jgi:NSS family neurotransmitter:Na+ symporter